MPIWGGSTKRGMSSSACAPLPLLWFHPPRSFEIGSIASCCYRACVWRPARQYEPDPPSRCDRRRRCGGILAADGGGRGGTLERLKALRRELLNRNFK